MSAMGHVWTAPWQELSDVSAALVGCGHVSGLLVRQVWPLALMLCADRVPNNRAHFRRSALTQTGSPDPPNDRICITSSCPRQLVLPRYRNGLSAICPIYPPSRPKNEHRGISQTCQTDSCTAANNVRRISSETPRLASRAAFSRAALVP